MCSNFEIIICLVRKLLILTYFCSFIRQVSLKQNHYYQVDIFWDFWQFFSVKLLIKTFWWFFCCIIPRIADIVRSKTKRKKSERFAKLKCVRKAQICRDQFVITITLTPKQELFIHLKMNIQFWRVFILVKKDSDSRRST
jgi:hypothetical protein